MTNNLAPRVIAPLIQISNNHKILEVREPQLEKLAKQVLQAEKISTREIHIIFVDDKYLRKLHKEYLNDPASTDVMSFDLSDDDRVEGEIYISLDSAKSHAIKFNVSYDSEIARLIVHGLLHLKGYDDSTPSERNKMRAREDYYLDMFLE